MVFTPLIDDGGQMQFTEVDYAVATTGVLGIAVSLWLSLGGRKSDQQRRIEHWERAERQRLGPAWRRLFGRR